MNRPARPITGKTFRHILEAIGAVSSSKPGSSSLEKWFYRVCDTPIVELSLEDTTRAFRQRVYVDALVQRAEVLLAENPLAGVGYPGELARSIAEQPRDFWLRHADFAIRFRSVATAALQEIESESDSAVFKKWMKKYGQEKGGQP